MQSALLQGDSRTLYSYFRSHYRTATEKASNERTYHNYARDEDAGPRAGARPGLPNARASRRDARWGKPLTKVVPQQVTLDRCSGAANHSGWHTSGVGMPLHVGCLHTWLFLPLS